MKGAFCVLLFGIVCVQITTCRHNFTKTDNRKGRIFSLFSIVQFSNDACLSTSGTFSNGTCFTSGECSSKGGSAQGNCAAGFGVCCVFSISATGSTVSQNCSYIVNPNYPSNYVPTSTPNTVAYTISKSSSDVCRIRLDYDQFTLDGPIALGADAATTGQCSTDRLTFTTTDRTQVPDVGVVNNIGAVIAGAADYGQYPYLCGTNTGYHSYLDMSCTSTDTATLSFILDSTATNQWKIKVTQYSCDDPTVASQQGCFQYHTGLTGTLQSYNLAGGVQLAGQNYKNCIRQEEGYCCIQYTVVSFLVSPATCLDITTNRCAGTSVCNVDAIIIPGASSSTAAETGITYDRFCGANLNSAGALNTNQPIISCECPFEVDHITGGTALGQQLASLGTGFQLTYSQLPGNC